MLFSVGRDWDSILVEGARQLKQWLCGLVRIFRFDAI